MPAGTERGPPGSARAAARGGAFAFFFYGTLCDADVRAAVIGRAIEVAPATLGGYEAVPVERGRFPILLAQPGREAQGVICEGVSLAEAARLGLYEHEGRDYVARALKVRAERGMVRAWAFLPTGALRRGPGRWDLTEWQRFAKAEFLARVQQRIRAIEARDLEPFVEVWRGRVGAA